MPISFRCPFAAATLNDGPGAIINRRHGTLLIIVLATSFIWAGGTRAQGGEVGATSSSNSLMLRPGDVLQISVWPNTELGGEFSIDEHGYVHLPVLEAVRVAGIPIETVRQELRRGYAQAMRNPVVNVTPLFSVIVTGAVQRPGVYSVTPTHSLFELIGMAGGFHQTADAEKVRVLRNGQVIRFDAVRALEYGEGMDEIQLRSGDQIVVPQSRQFNWRAVLTLLQTASILFVTYERLRR